MANTGIRYTAEIKDVREVALYGVADLPFWRVILRREGLFPYNSGGNAELVLSATALAWKGFKFREWIATVAICAEEHEAQHDGFYLALAFNTSRVLAFAERRFFKTPYYHGSVHVDEQTPALIDVSERRRTLFRAEMEQPRAPVSVDDEAWSGPVFLPNSMTKNHSQGQKFFVSVSGEQAIYAFSPTTDRLALSASEDHELFQWLIDSGFTATEWRIRGSAEHARSQTYDRAFQAASRAGG
ncbi:MAG TPA: hypothetical protein VFZ66_10150 [Herpetosiphonaceae bacterium]